MIIDLMTMKPSRAKSARRSDLDFVDTCDALACAIIVLKAVR